MTDGPIPLDEARDEARRTGSLLRSRALFWPELAKLPRPEYLIKGVLDAGSLAEIFAAIFEIELERPNSRRTKGDKAELLF